MKEIVKRFKKVKVCFNIIGYGGEWLLGFFLVLSVFFWVLSGFVVWLDLKIGRNLGL